VYKRQHCGTEGQVERLYWREEELWIRMRTCQGGWLSLPWHETDLPRLTAATPPACLPLSPPVLLELARHLKRCRQKRSSRVRKRA
ncbi:MAG: hypothetical protein WBM40_08455, partial [Thiohalocapsa sp.]